jgi:GxxExxY protein
LVGAATVYAALAFAPPAAIIRGQRLATIYRADFVCYNAVILELKALAKLTDIERAQIIHYLKATRLEAGLLLNFGAKSLEYERFIYSKPKSA